MKLYRETLKLITIAFGLLACSAAWAESNVGNSDPGLLWLRPYYDPNANGHKLSGVVTLVYDKSPVPVEECSMGSRVNKVYISVTIGQNATFAPFTSSMEGGFCLGREEFAQGEAIVKLVRDKVIPFYFDCSAGCTFWIKSITDYQYTTGHVGERKLPDDPTSGGVSATFTIAVR